MMREVVAVLIVEVAPLLRRRHCSKPVNLLISLSLVLGCVSHSSHLRVDAVVIVRQSSL